MKKKLRICIYLLLALSLCASAEVIVPTKVPEGYVAPTQTPAPTDTPAPTQTPEPDISLRYGDKNDEVLRLQTRLKELCYYNGPLSGQFAEVTRNAVKEVQKNYGLSQTGVADAATQEIIYGECYRALSYGMSGEDVKEMQDRLAVLSL